MRSAKGRPRSVTSICPVTIPAKCGCSCIALRIFRARSASQRSHAVPWSSASSRSSKTNADTSPTSCSFVRKCQYNALGRTPTAVARERIVIPDKPSRSTSPSATLSTSWRSNSVPPTGRPRRGRGSSFIAPVFLTSSPTPNAPYATRQNLITVEWLRQRDTPRRVVRNRSVSHHDEARGPRAGILRLLAMRNPVRNRVRCGSDAHLYAPRSARRRQVRPHPTTHVKMAEARTSV